MTQIATAEVIIKNKGECLHTSTVCYECPMNENGPCNYLNGKESNRLTLAALKEWLASQEATE